MLKISVKADNSLSFHKNQSMMIPRRTFLSAIILLLVWVSCTPDDIVDAKPEPGPSPAETKTYQQLLADSLYKYARQVYYWNTFLPDSATFNPLGYTRSDTLAGLKNELLALTRIPVNPSTGKPYEQYQNYNNGVITDVNTASKFSYAVLTSDLYGGGLTSNIIVDQKRVADLKMTLDGKENELGFTIAFVRASYLSGTPKALPQSLKDSIVGLVRIVTKGSPAWNAGVRRGDIIAKFNGNAWTYTNNLAKIESALGGSNMTLTTYDPVTGAYSDHPFDKTLYTFNPVYSDTLITAGSKKIAYVAYKSFTIGDNTGPALQEVFGRFSEATDLVIDLRYNGGGYVSTAEYFANTILPASANGGVLFKEVYNTTMQNKQATLLKNQPVYLNNIKQNYTYYDIDFSVGRNTTYIKKEGSFNTSGNIGTVYFIVSDNTASASELLINSVKPYFNEVYLINAPFSANDNPNYTYGKPIGFFEIRLGKYSVYMSNFESKNKNDEGGYYQGMKTDLRSNDDVRYDLGNPNESAFLAAIRRITGNSSYQPSSTSPRSVISGTNDQIVQPLGEPTKIYDMVVTPKTIR
ncbi:S41 family peptidase [Niabella aquatica]